MAAYCTIADVRAEGYAALEYPDARVTAMIAAASMLIDVECGRWFDVRTKTYTIMGRGDSILDLPHFPITITSITIIDPCGDMDETVVADDEYELMQDGEDPRRLPRLYYRNGVWPSDMKIVVVGTFGFVDDPLGAKVTPPEIKRLCVMWVGSLLPQLGAVGLSLDEIESEQIADYKYKLRSATEDSASSGDIREHPEARAIIDAFTNYEVG
jgi:hypothetical protein